MASRIHAITLVATLALSSCERASRTTPDDTIVVLIESTMTTGDPRFAVSGYDGKLSKLVSAGLTVVDSPTVEARLALAARVERVNDLTYDVWLRPDAKFSDGSPVLASDVAGTYEYMLDPATESVFHKTLSDRFTKVVAIGERHVRFHLKDRLATFMTDIDFGIVSCRNGVPKPHAAIGAGAYSIREITSRGLMLDANPHFYGGAPKTAHVEIKFVRDASARLLMLVGGSADLVQNAARYDLIDEVVARPGMQVQSGRSVFLTYLMMNNTDPILKDRRVRQAIALALDRPAIISAKFLGRARIANGLLPETHWAYVPGGHSWHRDLARAKHLLDDAGYPDPPGPAMRMTLVYKTSSEAFRVAVARTIAAQLGEIGIEVDLRSFEFATFFADVKKGTYQLASMQTADINEPDMYFTYYHSSWIPNEKNPDGYNRWRYINPDVDRLTEAGRRELDIPKRMAIYAEVQRIVSEDAPIIPLYHEDNFALMNADMQGYSITPNARLSALKDAWKRPRRD